MKAYSAALASGPDGTHSNAAMTFVGPGSEKSNASLCRALQEFAVRSKEARAIVCPLGEGPISSGFTPAAAGAMMALCPKSNDRRKSPLPRCAQPAFVVF
jgi:streptogramin lyase